MPKKICFISDLHEAFDDRIYWKLAIALKSNGYDVAHICKGKKQREFVSDEGIEIFEYDESHIKGLTGFKKLKKLLRVESSFSFLHETIEKVKADLYFISDINPLSLSDFIKNLDWKPKLGYDVHDPFYINILTYATGLEKVPAFFYSYYTKFWELKKLVKHDLIVTTEKNWTAYFRKNRPKIKISQVHNYPIFEPDKTEIDKKYDFIYAGSINTVRGLFNMINFMAELNKHTEKRYSLLIVGTMHYQDDRQKAEKLIAEHNLTNQVTLKDAIPHHEVKHLYKQSRFGLILFNDIRNFRLTIPIKLFEYMTFGLPIIGTNLGHIKDIIDNSKAGIIVDKDDLASAAQQTLQLIKNKEQQLLMIKNGFEAIENVYNWRKESSIFVKSVKDLIHD